jgi:hypothetical protein
MHISLHNRFLAVFILLFCSVHLTSFNDYIATNANEEKSRQDVDYGADTRVRIVDI